MSDTKNLVQVIDDGTREITLKNTFGKVICKVHIRVSDLSIMDRYSALMSGFDDIVAPLRNVNIKNDGSADTDSEWAVIKEVEANVIQKINELFDMDDASDIFKTRHAFSVIGGRFFCEIVLNALGDLIVQAVQEEAEASNKRMAKYLEATPDAGNVTIRS